MCRPVLQPVSPISSSGDTSPFGSHLEDEPVRSPRLYVKHCSHSSCPAALRPAAGTWCCHLGGGDSKLSAVSLSLGPGRTVEGSGEDILDLQSHRDLQERLSRMDLTQLRRGWEGQGEVLPVSWLSGHSAVGPSHWDSVGGGLGSASTEEGLSVGSTVALGLGLLSDLVPLSLRVTSVRRGTAAAPGPGWAWASSWLSWSDHQACASHFSAPISAQRQAPSPSLLGDLSAWPAPVWTHVDGARPLFPGHPGSL